MEPPKPATNRPWQIESFVESAGLANQRIYDIAFEPNGTVWIAAIDGLHRFDGYRWSVFGSEDGLPTRFIRTVLVTKTGELWVGSSSGAGVYDAVRRQYDPRGTKHGLPNNSIRLILEDTDGSLWFCCDRWPDASIKTGGLARLKNGKWETYDQRHGLPTDYTLNYYRAPSGRQFAMTHKGWVQRMPGEMRWTQPIEPGASTERMILHMAAAPDGSLFAQGEQRLFRLTDGTWKIVATNTVLVNTTREGEVVVLARDTSRDTAWFSLWNGQEFVRSSSPVTCPPQATFFKIAQAPDGSIWCVGYGTVLRWNYRMGAWQSYPQLSRPITRDSKSRVWFASESAIWWHKKDEFQQQAGFCNLLGIDNDGSALGLSASNGQRQLILSRPENPGQYDPVGTGQRSAFSINDSTGRLWLLTIDSDSSISLAYRDGASWTKLPTPDLSNRRIGSVLPDQNGGLWIVLLHQNKPSDFDVLHVEGLCASWVNLGSKAPSVSYPSFVEAAGRQWMLGDSGLFWRAPSDGNTWQKVTELPALGYRQMAAGNNEFFIIYQGSATSVSGCARFAGGSWQTQPGDFQRIYLSEDRKKIYLTARGSINIRRTPGSLDLECLPLPEDGFANVVVEGEDSTLWIGASDCVYRYRATQDPPEATIKSAVSTLHEGFALPADFGAIKRFAVSTPPTAFRYSWHFDHDAWSRFELSTDTPLATSGLAPGPHVLEVVARDIDGNISRKQAVLPFTILPASLQERAWFPWVSGCIALAIAFLAWLSAMRSRQSAQRNIALQAEIAERRRAESLLQAAHIELEKRVAERTQELSLAYASLVKETAERKQAEASRQQMEELLRQAQKMKSIGTLAGGIAHDFNNILTVIIPCTHLALEEAGENADIRENLQQVLLAAERAKSLVKQILAFSRQQKPQRSIVALEPIVKEAHRLLRSLLPSSIQLACETEPGTPSVLADPTQIHQVLMNLCSNSEHALRGRQGRIDIRLQAVTVSAALAKTHPDLRPGLYAKLSVIDNGAGITEEVIKRIFDPFFTTKDTGEGTGLGLSVVHGIVTDHEGAILVHSQPGIGSTFDIYLPARPAAETTPDIPPATDSPRGNGERILIIDDEASVIRALGKTLEQAGYRVTAHTQPQAAWEEFRLNPLTYSLVITDLAMPGLTGLQLCQQIRQISPTIPIMLATGYGGNCEQKDIEKLGISKIVFKPFAPQSMLWLVYDVLNPERASPAKE